MREVLYYEAFDGAMFDSEGECRLYEYTIKYKDTLPNILVYGCDGKSYIPTNYEDLIELVDDASYVYFKTDDAIEVWLEVCRNYRFATAGIEKSGVLYKYDGFNYSWFDFIAYVNKEAEKAEKVLKAMQI